MANHIYSNYSKIPFLIELMYRFFINFYGVIGLVLLKREKLNLIRTIFVFASILYFGDDDIVFYRPYILAKCRRILIFTLIILTIYCLKRYVNEWKMLETSFQLKYHGRTSHMYNENESVSSIPFNVLISFMIESTNKQLIYEVK